MSMAVLVTLGFVAAAAFSFFYSRHDWLRDRAGAVTVLEREARDGVAEPVEPPLVAPLSGRPAMAFHVEVLVRTRRPNGSLEEVVVERVHEESCGVFRHGGRVLDFTGAELLERPKMDVVSGVTLFASSTSMFTPSGHVPPPAIAHFLASRNLPMPSVDSAFAAGVGVAVNERVIVPGTALWTTEAGPWFGLGTVAEARARLRPPVGDLLSTSLLIGAVGAGITGMICAMVLRG